MFEPAEMLVQTRQLWISRDYLWINAFGCGKVTYFRKLSRSAYPHIWTYTLAYSKIWIEVKSPFWGEILWKSFPISLHRLDRSCWRLQAQYPGMMGSHPATCTVVPWLSTLSTGSTTITIPFITYIELEMKGYILYNKS